MKWSFSQHQTFRRCQRQWFYKYVFASSRAKDERRQEAYRLSKLVNIKAWRGKIVDDVISKVVVPSIAHRRPVDLETAKDAALRRFEEQKALGFELARSQAGDFRGFLEVANGTGLTDRDFEAAWSDVEKALKGFFGNTYSWEMMEHATRLFAQRFLSFTSNGASIMAVPDVICFYRDQPPTVLDWKVQSNPIGNYWTQLATYALAITRCKPHKDWPVMPSGLAPADIELAEVQLLTSNVRGHTVTDDEVEEIEELIACSEAEIGLARRGLEPKKLRPEYFSTARSPVFCQYCSFKALCWGCSDE